MTRTATMHGAPLPLAGEELHAGAKAPEFVLQKMGKNGLENVSLEDYKGKTLLLSVVPSLDTGVCATQTRTFNQRAAQLPDNVAVLTVSMDLPFAQKRFCGVENVEKLECASDHLSGEFGRAYGVYIEGGALERILARAVFVVDPQGVVKHAEYVAEIADEPNYDAALAAVN